MSITRPTEASLAAPRQSEHCPRVRRTGPALASEPHRSRTLLAPSAHTDAPSG